MKTTNFSNRFVATLSLSALAAAVTLLTSCALPQFADNKPYQVPAGAAVDTVYSTDAGDNGSGGKASHGKYAYDGSYSSSRHVQGAGIDSHPRVEAARWFAESLRGEARGLAAERYPRLNVQAATGYAYTSSDSSRSDSQYSGGGNGSSSAGSGGSMGSDWRARHEARLVLSQRLFDGRRSRYTEEAGMSLAMAAELSANTMAQTIAIDYSTAHLDYLQARDITNFANNLVEEHREMLSLTSDKLSRGLQSQADVDLVRSRLDRSQSLLKTQQLLLADAEVRFRTIAGKSPANVASPPRPSSSQLASLKLNQNSEVQSANETLRSRKLENQAARRLKYPNVDIEVGARAGDGFYGVASADEEVQALLVLSWDILDGGFRKSERYRTEAGIREAEALVKASKLDVRQLWDLGNELRTKSGERIVELNAYVTHLARAISALEADFASSKQPVLNVLDMQDELFEAKAERVLEYYNQMRGAYAMLAASGELVKTLEGSGVPTTRKTGTNLATKTTTSRAPVQTQYAASPAKAKPATVASAPVTRTVPAPARSKPPVQIHRTTVVASEPQQPQQHPAAAPAASRQQASAAAQTVSKHRNTVYKGQSRNPYRNPLGGFSGF